MQQIGPHIGHTADVHHDARRRLLSMFVTPARQVARDAIIREADRICAQLVRIGRVPEECAVLLAQSLISAALALVLRDLLPPELFELVYAPYTAGVHAS